MKHSLSTAGATRFSPSQLRPDGTFPAKALTERPLRVTWSWSVLPRLAEWREARVAKGRGKAPRKGRGEGSQPGRRGLWRRGAGGEGRAGGEGPAYYGMRRWNGAGRVILNKPGSVSRRRRRRRCCWEPRERGERSRRRRRRLWWVSPPGVGTSGRAGGKGTLAPAAGSGAGGGRRTAPSGSPG